MQYAGKTGAPKTGLTWRGGTLSDLTYGEILGRDLGSVPVFGKHIAIVISFNLLNRQIPLVSPLRTLERPAMFAALSKE
jgi:hypothetical protein